MAMFHDTDTQPSRPRPDRATSKATGVRPALITLGVGAALLVASNAPLQAEETRPRPLLIIAEDVEGEALAADAERRARDDRRVREAERRPAHAVTGRPRVLIADEPAQ